VGNQRGYVWLDESVERSDREEARAHALATRWSQLHNEAEERMFAAMADAEEGRGYDLEPDPCDVCGGTGYLGAIHPTYGCGNCGCPDELVRIKCTSPNCEDGYDVGPIREAKERRAAREEERRLEVEIVEEMLERLGARMARPYEHWNEDEQLVQWMERDRD
jgi:hypothetical protein